MPNLLHTASKDLNLTRKPRARNTPRAKHVHGEYFPKEEKFDLDHLIFRKEDQKAPKYDPLRSYCKLFFFLSLSLSLSLHALLPPKSDAP